MLIQRGARGFEMGTYLTNGGTASTGNTGITALRQNTNNSGQNRNFWAGEGTMSGGVSIANKAAFPNGYNPQRSWRMAIKGGGMATYNTINGTGTLVGSGNYGREIAADLAGLGDITNAAMALISGAVAALSGSGTLSASIQGALQAAASLAGSGNITAALGALAGLVADLDGDGSVTALLAGNGSLSADITVTGATLNTGNVGQAVWAYLITAGYSAEEILRLLAAVAAGKTNITDLGGGAAEVEFRDLADTKNAVVADMLNSERTTVTLDLE